MFIVFFLFNFHSYIYAISIHLRFHFVWMNWMKNLYNHLTKWHHHVLLFLALRIELWNFRLMKFVLKYDDAGETQTAAKEKPFSIVSEYIYDDFSGETAYSQAFFAMPCTPVSDNHVMSTTCGQRKMINYKNWKCHVRNEEKLLGISKTFHSGVESDSKQYPLVVPNPSSRHGSQAHNPHPQPQCQTHAKHKLLKNDRLGWGWGWRMIRTAD